MPKPILKIRNLTLMKTHPHCIRAWSAALTPLHRWIGRDTRSKPPLPLWTLAAGVLWLAGAISVSAQNVTQTIALRAGWNSIWVEVEPTNNAIGAVFQAVPGVEAVWSYFEKGSTADFIQNVNELPWNDPRWRRYFPPPSPKVVLNNLYTVNAHRAYLVKATNAAFLTLTGPPSVRPLTWVADAYNLRGFPIDPERRPAFDDFFAPATAHTGQPIYRLNTNGLWDVVAGYTVDGGGYTVRVPGTNRMNSGEAYWVYSQGASDYTAPLALRVDGGDGLDYADALNEQQIELRNLSSNETVVVLGAFSSGTVVAGEMPLAYHDPNAPLGSNWVTFASPQAEFLAVGNTLTRRMAIRRSALPQEHYEALLYLGNNTGTRYLCPVRAEKRPAATGGEQDHTGLWVGNAVINGVSQARDVAGTNGTAPVTPTLAANGSGSEFNLRLLVHVDGQGVPRLLKQVIQLWREGAYVTNASSGVRQADTNHPGGFVLVTDDERIGDFTGATLRDGEPVGRRISCVGLDFPDEPGQPPNTRRMSGTVALRGHLTNQFTLPSDFPTHPFKHRQHPDHDNLAADFATARAEAPAITRTIELHFSPQAPPGQSVADYGYNVLAGTYREVLRGLHQRELVVTGTFRLSRVSFVGELNPAKASD